MEKKPILVIVGPTASGKSSLAVELAKIFYGEVISADSMQIYKGMDIATAKPSIEQMQGIKHHLISFVEQNQSFSVADYVSIANKTIEEVSQRGKLPILAGGTGLYISSLIDNIKFDDSTSNLEIREKLYSQAKANGNKSLLEKLNEIDPETASLLHENNLSRIIRALEIFEVSGKLMSNQKINSRLEESPYNFCIIGLNYANREDLYSIINERVDIMTDEGLVEEARLIYENTKLKTAHQAIGYKELLPYFENKISLQKALDSIKQLTRNYAKRQLTWFRRDLRINWIELNKNDKIEKIIENAKIIIANSNIIWYN